MREYVAIIEQSESGSWSAHVPDLPGCVAAGADKQETAELMRKAIEMHLAGMREDGDPIPEPTTIAEYVTRHDLELAPAHSRNAATHRQRAAGLRSGRLTTSGWANPRGPRGSSTRSQRVRLL